LQSPPGIPATLHPISSEFAKRHRHPHPSRANGGQETAQRTHEEGETQTLGFLVNEGMVRHPSGHFSFVPTTRWEMEQLGWGQCDIVLVTGDAYVDHPSFGTALIGRHLQSLGYRVGIIPQPDWTSSREFLALGVPRLFVGVSSGAMDSMVHHYTSMNRLRSADDYSEHGAAGRRPDRAVLVYVNRIQQAMPGVPIVLGGIEASLRRLSHYDFWSDRVRKSILLDSKATILVYGMGEQAVEQIARKIEDREELGGIRGTAVFQGAGSFDSSRYPDAVWLPPHEEVVASRKAFMELTRTIERESHPENGHVLLQRSDNRVVIVFPPPAPMSEEELDAIYALPFRRMPHPRYRGEIPAFAMIRDSLTVVRGCGGGCSFCALGLHQGRTIQCRSESSVLAEAESIKQMVYFRGTISDVGGPTANLYGLGCRSPQARGRCHRSSCLFPGICRHFRTDHSRYVRLLRALRGTPGVQHVFVSSGIRFDVALKDDAFLAELVEHHVSGHLKVAPEHFSDAVLVHMRKPVADMYRAFARRFENLTTRCRKEQYLVPYLISGFPGCTMEDMRLAERELRGRRIRPQQVQSFLPTPMTIATAMYYTGLNPHTGEEIYVARLPHEKREQLRCLLYDEGNSEKPRRPAPKRRK
jgi:uncharacterized radical SAM protein YgiQ